MSLTIIKFGHAAVRIEQDAHALVIDPGVLTEPEAVDGATAIFVTHGHPDHLSLDLLRATSAPIYTIAAVAEDIAGADPALLDRVVVVAPGDVVDAGVPVEVVGERHAPIHATWPTGPNSGYLVRAERVVFHPGDAFLDPGTAVDVLCLPISAPWASLGEVIDYALRIGAGTNLAVHDQIYGPAGLMAADHGLRSALPGARYARLESGEAL